MTYIINPIWFYFASVVDALKVIMTVIAIVMLVGVVSKYRKNVIQFK